MCNDFFGDSRSTASSSFFNFKNCGGIIRLMKFINEKAAALWKRKEKERERERGHT